jgi:glycosyltransferase involved in cell wall biosynthesis
LTAPGLATRAKRLDAALDALQSLASALPALRLVVAGRVDPELPLGEWIERRGLGQRVRVTGRLTLPDFVLHLCAADVIWALRFPHHGEISGALVRGLGVGRPALVTAGSPAADEFPEGVVVPVDPGPHEAAELQALLLKLCGDQPLRDQLGALARDHVRRRHELGATIAALVAFLSEALAQKAAALAEIAAGRAPAGSLHELLQQELAYAAFDLGLGGFELGGEALLRELLGGER